MQETARFNREAMVQLMVISFNYIFLQIRILQRVLVSEWSPDANILAFSF